jgi:hypothetical protein
MVEPDNQLILETVKKIQAGIADLRLRSDNIEEQLSSIRHILVAMQTGDLHQEARVTALRADVDAVRADVDAIKQHLMITH